MASARSRYRRVPGVTVPDARRGVVVATDLRPLPEVTGTYRHTLSAGDRLDRLAWIFYGDPLQFWRICDANPDFLSPLALVGQEALVTTRFPVAAPADALPWSALLAALAGTVGVDDVTLVEETRLEQQGRTVGAVEVTVTVERPLRIVVVTYHPDNVDAAALAAVMDAAGVTVGPPADDGQVGRSLVVPVAAPG